MDIRKKYFVYLIAGILFMPACSASNIGKEEVVTTSNGITVTEPVSENIIPTISVTKDVENSYFYKDSSQPIMYQGSLGFGDEFVERTVTLGVNYMEQLKDGNLYELKLDYAEEIPEDRGTIGYFYVQEDKIYKINATEDSLNQFRESGELPSDSVIVCQEEGYEDSLGELEKGDHQYLEVDGDKRVYHSYNNQVESGYYETFTWELGKGLINYRSGYGAESDSIELNIISNLDQSTDVEPVQD